MHRCRAFTQKLTFATALLGLATYAMPIAAAIDERAPPCALPDRPLESEPALCARLADDAVDVHGQDRVNSLIEASRREVAQSRHDRAARSLDCAESLLPMQPDAELRRRVFRARAALDYARERMPEALGGLQCALAISSAGDDRKAEASDLNAVGSALRRLGDYRGALAALTESLRMQRATGDPGGAVLNNIADVYRELGEREEALDFYRRALAVYREAGEHGHAAHVMESMAVVALEDGDSAQAREWLGQALEIYRERRQRDYQVRTYGWLIRAALAEGDLEAARGWSAAGQAVAAEASVRLPTAFQLQAARTERLSGAATAAVARLQRSLSTPNGPQPSATGEERAQLYAELAAAQEAVGDSAGAIASLQRAREEADAFARARHDRQLGWLRARFETAERDRTIARLESDNRQRRLQLGLLAALALAAMLGGWLWFQRRSQREREREAARLARKEEELARYRRETDALAEDRQLLQALLDSREEALCLLDAEGQVLAANRAACRLLGAGTSGLVGQGIADGLDATQRDALSVALEGMEDATTQTLMLSDAGGRAVCARLSPWAQGDGPILLELRLLEWLATGQDSLPIPSAGHVAERTDDGGDVPTPVSSMQEEGAPSRDSDTDDVATAGMRDAFRRALVELMLAAVEGWERSTGDTRLSLAEKSRIWRVAIDDGRLRARSMERYLSLSRLPQRPRWRDVLRTAYYVLENCSLSPDVRATLQTRVDAVLAFTRRSALV